MLYTQSAYVYTCITCIYIYIYALTHLLVERYWYIQAPFLPIKNHAQFIWDSEPAVKREPSAWPLAFLAANNFTREPFAFTSGEMVECSFPAFAELVSRIRMCSGATCFPRSTFALVSLALRVLSGAVRTLLTYKLLTLNLAVAY